MEFECECCFSIIEHKDLMFSVEEHWMHGACRKPSLGLMTKVRACNVAGQEKKPGSERKCEGMNLHTPKGAFTLGVGVLVDSRM